MKASLWLFFAAALLLTAMFAGWNYQAQCIYDNERRITGIFSDLPQLPLATGPDATLTHNPKLTFTEEAVIGVAEIWSDTTLIIDNPTFAAIIVDGVTVWEAEQGEKE